MRLPIGAISGKERKQLLNHFAEKIVERADEIALVESMDCGQPLRFMKAAAVQEQIFPVLQNKAPGSAQWTIFASG